MLSLIAFTLIFSNFADARTVNAKFGIGKVQLKSAGIGYRAAGGCSFDSKTGACTGDDTCCKGLTAGTPKAMDRVMQQPGLNSGGILNPGNNGPQDYTISCDGANPRTCTGTCAGKRDCKAMDKHLDNISA